MSILGSIVSAIFHHAGVTTSAQAAPASPGAAPASGGVISGTMPPKQPANSVDVNAALTKLASQNKEKLDWQHSIVDLMKLLNLDSSLHARKDLAKELHYTGDTDDSAKMNMWLHAQVMEKLAENGGKVPADLMHK
jgi:Domain of unknown function (DUF3597)